MSLIAAAQHGAAQQSRDRQYPRQVDSAAPRAKVSTRFGSSPSGNRGAPKSRPKIVGLRQVLAPGWNTLFFLIALDFLRLTPRPRRQRPLSRPQQARDRAEGFPAVAGAGSSMIG